MMTDDQRRTIDLFEYALTQLHVDDEGCAASEYADVVTCANLCLAVRHATADVATVETLLLRRLVAATEDLLTTFVVVAPNNPAIVETWHVARGELLSYRLGVLR
jgi:hypothetical protein